MPHEMRFNESETMLAYVTTVASSMEAILPMLVSRYGANDKRALIAREIAAKLRELESLVNHMPPLSQSSEPALTGRTSA